MASGAPISLFVYLICALLLQLLFPSLNFFAPLIITSFYRMRRIRVLWLTLAIGLTLDLFAFSDSFINVIAYPVAAFVLYPQKQNFFIDSLSTYPILTFVYSSLVTLILWAILAFPIGFAFLFKDLLYYPCIDALIAFAFLTLPQIYWGPKIRKGSEYFL